MLTKKEKETYDFIIDFQRKYGQFPLLTEIADGIGITSKGVVHRYVKSLVDQDKIQKIRYKHRGYMLKKIGSDISFSIKKLGKISAGGPIEAIPDKEILELNHIFSNEKCFALKVQGNSMIDAGINDGDWVIIEKNNKIIKSKVLAILIDNQEVTLKFAKLLDKELIQLIPANKNLKPKSYNLERIEVQGIVIGQIRVL